MLFKKSIKTGKPPKEKLSKEVEAALKDQFAKNHFSAIKPLPCSRSLTMEEKVEQWAKGLFSWPAKA